MRKEYIPAILIYVASVMFFVASAICAFLNHYTWATWLLIGFALLIFASSRLVKIGQKLRNDEERDNK